MRYCNIPMRERCKYEKVSRKVQAVNIWIHLDLTPASSVEALPCT